jgi:hypothetical protein
MAFSYLSLDDLSGPISAPWERDPVILQATATRYGCVKCSGLASEGIIMLENPNVTLLQIRYNNRPDDFFRVPLSSEISRHYDQISSHYDVCPPKPSHYHTHNGHVRRHYLGPDSPLVSFKFEPCHQQMPR